MVAMDSGKGNGIGFKWLMKHYGSVIIPHHVYVRIFVSAVCHSTAEANKVL